MTQKSTGPRGINTVRSNDQVRLCRRPARLPGVAPACEDDRIYANGYGNSDEAKRAKVSLPEVKWLKRGAA